jgi:hypothetical protein
MGAVIQIDGARAEAERQLAAASARHREAVTSTRELGRPESGQYASIKSLGRAVHVVSFTLRRAAAAGVPFDRLVELTGWEPDLVREGLERLPETRVIARLARPGVDPIAVAQAAATFEATARLRELTQRVLVYVDPDLDLAVEAPPALAPADVEDLHDRLEAAWTAWRQGLGRRET